jgi:hypothetical protein
MAPMLATVCGARAARVWRPRASVLAARRHVVQVPVAERADHVSWLSQMCARRIMQENVVGQKHVDAGGNYLSFVIRSHDGMLSRVSSVRFCDMPTADVYLLHV